jgi:cyclic pyranopterin phosphate synthase
VKLTHLDESGRARMVDVSGKADSRRTAEAEGQVRMSPAAYAEVEHARITKGDVLGVAELAGTMAAKRAGELIPLCHPLALDAVTVRAMLDPALPGIRIRATATTVGRTGVEMEALTAAAVACLTVYDMVKAVDRGMVIDAVRLLSKTGGSSGDWHRDRP